METYAFRAYVTESLRLQGENKYLTKSWVDVIDTKVDYRTGEEVAADVIRAAGLILKGGEDV